MSSALTLNIIKAHPYIPLCSIHKLQLPKIMYDSSAGGDKYHGGGSSGMAKEKLISISVGERAEA